MVTDVQTDRHDEEFRNFAYALGNTCYEIWDSLFTEQAGVVNDRSLGIR
jgi:hypothetical protein